MQIKYIFSLLFFSFLSLHPEISIPATKKTNRNLSANKSRTSSSNRTQIRVASSNSISNQSSNLESQDSGITISEDNCEFYYNLCMNKICANTQIGKCVCYEDKYTNSGSSVEFLTFDNTKVKKGFDLFEYAKKQCVYILDNCMENRRSITEKYKTLVQRDCLLVSNDEVKKDNNLLNEFNNLKSCLRDYCTVYDDFGNENFSFPEFGLCFDEDNANLMIDANCSSIIANSQTPLGLKELFLNDMALKREEACRHMGGQISSDRKSCYINVSYGVNKDNISASKNIPVGEYFYCNSMEFDTNLGFSQDYLKQKKYRALTLTADSLRTAGSITSMVLGDSPVGQIVDASITLTGEIANTAIDIKDAIDGKISKEVLLKSLLSKSVSNILLPTLSLAGNLKPSSSSSSNIVDLTADTNAKFGKIGQGLSIASDAVGLASSITDATMQSFIDDIITEKEKSGIKPFAEFQNREQGVGVVNQTNLNRGNCFINGEWVATENEIILLQWQI